MSPTLRLSDEVGKRLARYREAIGVDTDEEAIRRLLRLRGTDSAFGVMAGWGSWSDADRLTDRSADPSPDRS